jgi:hypothetical protein
LVTCISFFVCHLNASSWRWNFLRRIKFLHDLKKRTVSVEISHLRETRIDRIRKQRHKLVYFIQCTIFLLPANGEGEAVREAGGLTNAWANHGPEISSNREREREWERETRRQPSGRNTEIKQTRTEINYTRKTQSNNRSHSRQNTQTKDQEQKKQSNEHVTLENIKPADNTKERGRRKIKNNGTQNVHFLK